MLVQLAEITFGYAGEDLFEGLTWQVNAGERIGLVGPNGAGKSTLLRLMAGTIKPQGGQVARARGTRIGYLLQSQELGGEGTVLEALLAPFAELLAKRAELDELSTRLDDAAALDRYTHLEEEFARNGGWALDARVRALAADVGFSGPDLERGVGTLSGGERNRLELAKVLLAAPDLLLLDEPTNHLDTPAIERLEAFLAAYPHAFVIVSHDRLFLDRVVSKIVEVEDGAVDEYPQMSFSRYVEERDRRRAIELAAVEKQQAEIAKTEDFIRRNIAGQKTKQAQGRRKLLARIERLTVARDMWADAGRIGLRFDVGDRPGGKEVLTVEGVSIGHEGAAPLADGIDLTIYRGDRVGIVGPNGAGKTTLLKTLIGKLPPVAGVVRRGHEVKPVVFDQKLGDLDETRSLIDEIRAVRADLAADTVRTYLARFRFFGDDAFRVVKGLSGGERNRLSLAKMMLRPANLLVLDEPTNHLDIPAREVLERALKAYEGTLLVVSHDRFFLDQVVTSLIVIDDGEVELHRGNFSDWRRRAKPVEKVAVAAAPKAAPKAAPAPPTAAKEKFAEDKAQKAAREKLERKQASLEVKVGELETKLADVRGRLGGDHSGDWQALHGLVQEEQDLSRALERALADWEDVGRRLTQKPAR